MLWYERKSYRYNESSIDNNHLLYKINKYIDFSFTRKIARTLYSRGQGRPSIDPEIFFRILFISYIYNISSDRRLCEEVRYNFCYRWFCKIPLKDKIPDHSWLSKTRKRFGEKVFAEFFATILDLCRKYGLLEARIIITDSSLIKANASLDSLTPIDAEVTASEARAKQNAKNKLGPPASRKISNNTYVSKTDSDASLAKKEGSPRELKYKIHNSIDAISRVIIDTKVTTGKTHDCQIYIDRLNYITQKHRITIEEVIADRGYGSREIIGTLQKQGITTYIPLFSSQSGKSIQEAYKAGFVYEKEYDRFVCPAGQYLNPYGFMNKESKYYRSKSSDCAVCTQKNKCIASSRSNRKSIKYLIRNIHQELFDKTFDSMQKPEFISRLKERMWKIEGIFAEAKQLHGLSKARYRGLQKVQIQAYMVATVQNVKRLIKHLIIYPNFKLLRLAAKYFFNSSDHLLRFKIRWLPYPVTSQNKLPDLTSLFCV